jgi:tyrosinase
MWLKERYAVSIVLIFLLYSTNLHLLPRYWDWRIDSSNVPKSKIWDPHTGFGGNGSPNKTFEIEKGYDMPCVVDRPFDHWQPKYHITKENRHCLARQWNDGSENIGDMFSSQYAPEAVKKIQAIQRYDEYRQRLESGPHGAIHSAIGGDMIPNSSPNGK